MNKVVIFLREVKAELEKVTWTKYDDLVGSVVIVCILSIFFALIIGCMDVGINAVIKKMITW